jgi:hypothetical protein
MRWWRQVILMVSGTGAPAVVDDGFVGEPGEVEAWAPRFAAVLGLFVIALVLAARQSFESETIRPDERRWLRRKPPDPGE